MTVETVVNTVFASGNDSATSFSFAPLLIFDVTELQVTKVATDGTETLLTLGTDYTIPTAIDPEEGTTGAVTYPPSGSTRLATGERLMMRRVRPLTQETALENQGGYFPEVQESTFDKLAMVDIQQQEEIDHALMLPLSSSINPDIPPGGLAGQILVLNPEGTAFIWVDKPHDGVPGPQGDPGPAGPAGASGAGTGDMLAANNLSDVANVATARTNLGLVIGTNVEAWSAKLDVLAALTYAANKIVKWTGTGAAVLIDFLNENDMASNSSAAVPSQASVKAYVDNHSLPSIPTGNLLANTTGGSAQPVATGLSALIDFVLGSTRGALLGRGAGGWALYVPGTSGFALCSNGAGADPSYQQVSKPGQAISQFSNDAGYASAALIASTVTADVAGGLGSLYSYTVAGSGSGAGVGGTAAGGTLTDVSDGPLGFTGTWMRMGGSIGSTSGLGNPISAWQRIG